MASTSRLDERNTLRMYVFQPQWYRTSTSNDWYYFGRPMKASEREVLMGFPKGYMEGATEHLFELLAQACKNTKDWRETLHQQYHHFRGNYHALPDSLAYKFVFRPGDSGFGEIRLKMAPPPTGKTPVSVLSYGYGCLFSLVSQLLSFLSLPTTTVILRL